MQYQSEAKAPERIVPWQVWTRDTFGNAELEEAESFVEKDSFDKAIAAYRKAEIGPHVMMVKREAFLRRIGTELKVGRSKELLNEVSRYVERSGMGLSQLDPRVSLVVSYAYYHRGETEQAFAWLSLAYRVPRGRGLVSRRAERTAEILIRAVPQNVFDEYDKRWSTDEFIGRVFRNEKLRRMQGGTPGQGISMAWFEGKNSKYRTVPKQELRIVQERPIDVGLGHPAQSAADKLVDPNQTFELSPPVSSARMELGASGIVTVGVLLPLTGEYARHAAQVRSGIELAFEQFRPQGAVRLAFGDTAGETDQAIAEYARLIGTEGASVVLGPMLVRCTEGVAVASKTHGVPFISFTKRREIPELGTSVFRLGATVNNQVAELVRYASEYLGVKTYTIIYPDTPVGREFALNFRQEVNSRRGMILGLVDYQPTVESSLDRAADEIASRPTQAVFMPDTLDRVWTLSEKLREMEVQTPIMLGPALWDDPIAIRGYGAALNGSVYVTPFYARSSQGPVADFRMSFEAKHDRPPELLGAQAFDAAELVFQAAISTDGMPASIARALRTESGVRGVTGVLTVTPSGEIERRMSVLRLKDGESLEVMSAGDIVGHYPEEQEIESTPKGDIS